MGGGGGLGFRGLGVLGFKVHGSGFRVHQGSSLQASFSQGHRLRVLGCVRDSSHGLPAGFCFGEVRAS